MLRDLQKKLGDGPLVANHAYVRSTAAYHPHPYILITTVFLESLGSTARPDGPWVREFLDD